MTDKYSFAIIGREYVADVDVKIQRIEAVKEFETYIQDVFSIETDDTVPDENILILWNGFNEKENNRNKKKFKYIMKKKRCEDNRSRML